MALTLTRNFPKLLIHCNKQAGTYFSINASLCFHHYLNINLEDSGLRQMDNTLYFIPVFFCLINFVILANWLILMPSYLKLAASTIQPI